MFLFGITKTILTFGLETKTNIMNTKELTIISTEEFSGETVLFMSNGSEVKFETSKLIDFIEENELNTEDEYIGNSSPIGDGNPCYDKYQLVETCEASEYLDNNYDEVCELYYNSLNK